MEKKTAGSPASVNLGGFTGKSNLGEAFDFVTICAKERLGAAKEFGSGGQGTTTSSAGIGTSKDNIHRRK